MTDKLSVYELLDQDKIWLTKEGKFLLIDNMAPAHIHNLLAWFERRAFKLKQVYELAMVISGSGPLGPSGDMACDAFDSECEELWNTPELVWLNEFPLIQKLRELQRAYRAAEVKLAKARNLAPTGATAGLDRNRERRFYTSLIKEHLT
jgi:hypothetical protein